MAAVQIIDHVVAIPKPDEIQIKFVPHGFDQTEQVLIFLRLTIEVTLLVNQPGDRRVRSETVAELFSAKSRRANEIRPPMIVRLGLVLLPLFERRSADENDPFTFRDVVAGTRGESEDRQ